MPVGITQLVPKNEAAWHASLRTSIPPPPPGGPAATHGVVANAGRASNYSNIPVQHQHHQIQNSLVGGHYATPIDPNAQHADQQQPPPPPRGSSPFADSAPAADLTGGRGPEDFSPRFARNLQQPATEQDLQDAIESLKHARMRHRSLVKDLYGGQTVGPTDDRVEQDLQKMKMASHKQAVSSRHYHTPSQQSYHRKTLTDTMTARGQLSSEVSYLKSQVNETLKAAQHNDHMMKNQMGQIKSEIAAVQQEVSRLEHVVGTMNETVAIAQDKLGDLREYLAQVVAEKDQLTLKLQHFMVNTKGGYAQAQREMISLDSEIERLSTENEFLRVQAARKR